MGNIYVVICNSGDCDSNYTQVCSAWKTISLAEQEISRLESEVKLIEKENQDKVDFCEKCPINDYNLPVEVVEKLAKDYCKQFSKDDYSSDEEIFCENYYQSENFGEWKEFVIKEIQLN